MFKYEIGFIGGGNMASAMIERFVESKVIAPEKILVCDKNACKLDKFNSINCAVTFEVERVIKECKMSFVAVKPQAFNALRDILEDNVKSEVVVSIMAGKTKASIKEVVGNDCSSIVRLMPNLACRYGEGVTLAELSSICDNEKVNIKKLLSALGLVVEIEEKDFNFCSAVSGCGPAFFFEYFKYFFDVCMEYGIDSKSAREMVLQTALGSAKLALSKCDSFEQLIASECSKGGSTIEGIKVLEQSDMCNVVNNAVNASKNRNDELERY